MMISTVLDVLNTAKEGDVVPAVRGTLTKLYKRTSGTKKTKPFAPYARQGGEISDGENVIGVSFWDHPELATLKGQEIIMICHLGPKGGLSGIKMTVYDDKPQLSVDDKATVQLDKPDEAEPPQQQTPPAKTPQATTPAANTPPPQSKPATPAAHDPADDKKVYTPNDLDPTIRRRLMQYANLLFLCERAADYVGESYRSAGGKEPGDTSTHQKRSATLFIAMSDEGAQNKMPGKKLTINNETV